MAIKTVGDLRRLLATHPDDAGLVVLATPDHNGWCNRLLGMVGTSPDLPDTVLLGLAGELTSDNDVEAIWPARPV